MTRNLGYSDRGIRVIIALSLIIMLISGITQSILLITLLSVISGIFILTAIIGICPLYSLFGLNSNPGGQH